MDYSKWRKILTILMIISICFSLFGKISKSFGSYTTENFSFPNDSSRNFTIPDWITNDYYYLFLVTPHRGSAGNVPYFSYKFAISKNEFSFNSVNSGSLVGTDIYRLIDFSSTFSGNSSSVVNQYNGYFNQVENSTGFESFSNNYFTTPVTKWSIGSSYNNYLNILNNSFYLCNFDVKNSSNDIVFSSNTTKYPEIATPIEDLETLNFDNISVNSWDWNDKNLYILFYDRTLLSSESTEGLYPVKEILLNKKSKFYQSDISTGQNSIYWVPNDYTGLNFKIGGKYEIRLAERINNEDGSFSYSYLGKKINFTINEDVSQIKINSLNEAIKNIEEKERHSETINAIEQQTQATQDLNNNIFSNEINENQANDTLTGMTGSADNIDDSQYTGLFSAIFGKFSNIITGDFSSVEEIRYPMPNTDKEIVLTSDLLSSKIKGTFIYILLQSFWLFLFGMYIFKFSNNLIRKIKDGSILNGYENKDEVITSTML